MMTRRRFISITFMILALFVLFQGPQIVRNRYNEYDFNAYYEDSVLDADSVWNEEAQAKEEVLLIGHNESLERFVREWARYSKRRVLTAETLEEGCQVFSSSTQLVIIPGELWQSRDTETDVNNLLEQNATILFTGMPETERLEDSRTLRNLFGISEIVQDEVTVDGIRLFKGFLLGGERLFIPFNEAEEKRQDMDLELTWYRTGAGVETYMMGFFEESDTEEKLDNEELPPVLWSIGQPKGKVYTMQCDFMDDRMIAMGILSAVMADVHELELYPVVNAQQLQILNFPSLADENEEKIMELYSRSQTQFERNIVYPGIVADTDGNGFKVTSYINPQYDYQDDSESLDQELTWYLSQMKEQNAEMGYSLVHNDSVSFEQKLAKDMDLLMNEVPNYKYSAIYVSAKEAEQAVTRLIEPLSSTVHTVCTENYEDKGLLDYLTKDITVQQSTATVNSYTFTNDLQMLGAETALGYASISIDMERILWPNEEDDQWQNASRLIFSVIDTYWSGFKMLDKTTASETDRNIRNLLALSYDYTVQDETIHLVTGNHSGEVYFILRTHNRKVDEVTDGSFVRIEQDAYLIRTEASECDIILSEDISMRE